jgi:hypothetical protein
VQAAPEISVATRIAVESKVGIVNLDVVFDIMLNDENSLSSRCFQAFAAEAIHEPVQ